MDRAYYIYQDGSRYEGEFKDDKANGQGIFNTNQMAADMRESLKMIKNMDGAYSIIR